MSSKVSRRVFRDIRRRSSESRLCHGERLEQRYALAVLALVGPAEAVNEGTRAIFTIELAESAKVPQRISISTASGSATYGVDYFVPVKQTILFAPGQKSQTFSISILKDSAAEKRETFTVVATAEDPRLGRRSQVVSIVDAGGSDGASLSAKSKFQITFTYDATVTESLKAKLRQAADRWSNVIVGDLPDVVFEGRTIDDLEIAVTVSPAADLPAGVIAGAGYDQRRSGDRGLPFRGFMEISEAYVRAPGIMNTLTHEIGHSLGFGSLWQGQGGTRSLVSGVGTANPIYIGTNAVREYNTIFGLSGASVPLYEQSRSNPPVFDGSYASHWRDTVFTAAGPSSFELMSSRYDVSGLISGRPVPAILSRVTVGAMQDIGYVVSYGNVEKYVKPARAINGQTQGGGVAGGGANHRDTMRSKAFSTLSATVATLAGPQSQSVQTSGRVGSPVNASTAVIARPPVDRLAQGGYSGSATGRVLYPETTAGRGHRPAAVNRRISPPVVLRPAIGLGQPCQPHP